MLGMLRAPSFPIEGTSETLSVMAVVCRSGLWRYLSNEDKRSFRLVNREARELSRDLIHVANLMVTSSPRLTAQQWLPGCPESPAARAAFHAELRRLRVLHIQTPRTQLEGSERHCALDYIGHYLIEARVRKALHGVELCIIGPLGCSQPSSATWMLLADAMPSLREIWIVGLGRTGVKVHAAAQLRAMAPAFKASESRLERLTLPCLLPGRNAADSSLQFLALLPRLRHLQLPSTNLEAMDMLALARAVPQLEVLIAQYIGGISKVPEGVSDQPFKDSADAGSGPAPRMPRLRTLGLNSWDGCTAGEAGMQHGGCADVSISGMCALLRLAPALTDVHAVILLQGTEAPGQLEHVVNRLQYCTRTWALELHVPGPALDLLAGLSSMTTATGSGFDSVRNLRIRWRPSQLQAAAGAGAAPAAALAVEPAAQPAAPAAQAEPTAVEVVQLADPITLPAIAVVAAAASPTNAGTSTAPCSTANSCAVAPDAGAGTSNIGGAYCAHSRRSCEVASSSISTQTTFRFAQAVLSRQSSSCVAHAIAREFEVLPGSGSESANDDGLGHLEYASATDQDQDEDEREQIEASVQSEGCLPLPCNGLWGLGRSNNASPRHSSESESGSSAAEGGQVSGTSGIIQHQAAQVGEPSQASSASSIAGDSVQQCMVKEGQVRATAQEESATAQEDGVTERIVAALAYLRSAGGAAETNSDSVGRVWGKRLINLYRACGVLSGVFPKARSMSIACPGLLLWRAGRALAQTPVVTELVELARSFEDLHMLWLNFQTCGEDAYYDSEVLALEASALPSLNSAALMLATLLPHVSIAMHGIGSKGAAQANRLLDVMGVLLGKLSQDKQRSRRGPQGQQEGGSGGSIIPWSSGDWGHRYLSNFPSPAPGGPGTLQAAAAARCACLVEKEERATQAELSSCLSASISASIGGSPGQRLNALPSNGIGSGGRLAAGGGVGGSSTMAGSVFSSPRQGMASPSTSTPASASASGLLAANPLLHSTAAAGARSVGASTPIGALMAASPSPCLAAHASSETVVPHFGLMHYANEEGEYENEDEELSFGDPDEEVNSSDDEEDEGAPAEGGPGSDSDGSNGDSSASDHSEGSSVWSDVD